MTDIEDTTKCYKFIYCNNYTKNFKCLFCDDTEGKYITDQASEPDINIKDLYARLLRKLKLQDNSEISSTFHYYNYLEDIYNKVTLEKLDNKDNYHYLIEITDIFTNCPETLAIIYSYVYLSDIDFSSVNCKLQNENNDIVSFDSICPRDPSIELKGLPIITPQSSVRANTIKHYLDTQSTIKTLPPPIFEYENNKLVLADGNHRIAYYLLYGKEPISPAIIIIQNPEDILKQSEQLQSEPHKYYLRSSTINKTSLLDTKSRSIITKK
jgi:hypothetical protein